ncbi:MAG: tRNA (adenosine(37)-N6)-threonylcarbamoyltransferase complex dimerization subunit type 1 TsaB [Alphaproteobacteria bacterium]|nr:tRNA (adenosine(37)-N6)-threonylcarbamoyltransferase complex dimerization subunit type 1 TsaB [Alphaproteobacteria bacterium]
MRSLALDSATSRCSIAVLDGEVLAAHRGDDAAAGQGDGLPLAVAAALDAAGMAIATLDRLAVTIGPGRFTGLRAGLAFMRGLALATGKPLVGVTTLEALAHGARGRAEPDETILACIDSRRAELFFQRFAADGSALSAPFAATPEALVALLPAAPRILAVGEHAARVASVLAAVRAGVRAHESTVDAADVARLAATRAAPAVPPAPLYIHPPATTAPRRAVGLAS